MPPRSRKDPSLSWLPTRVYVGKAAYEWRTPDGKCVRLCTLTARPQQVLAAYDKARSLEPLENSFAWLVAEYQQSDRYARLAAATKADYGQAQKRPLAVFGHVEVTTITRAMIRRYMDLRGKKSRYRANRELSWMYVVFAHGCERDYVDANPCAKIHKFPEGRRDRYVERDEYQAARDRAPLPLRVAMELAYCTGLRQADILALTWDQVKPDGILVRQSKTGGKLLKEITPRVQAALDLARTLPKPAGIECWHIVHTQAGRRYTRSGFATAWHRLAAGFTFHDLRRAGATDFEGERKKFTGHASDAMAESYNVKPIRSPSH